MLANGEWDLTLILLTWTSWRAPTNARNWRMGFNSAFKGLNFVSMSIAEAIFIAAILLKVNSVSLNIFAAN